MPKPEKDFLVLTKIKIIVLNLHLNKFKDHSRSNNKKINFIKDLSLV